MAQIYSKDYLKTLLNNIFVNNINQLDLANNLKTLIELDAYPDSVNNFTLMAILSLLEDYDAIPLLKTFAQQLKLKLIFSCYSEPIKCCEENIVKEKQPENCIENNRATEEETKKINKQSDINQRFWNKYSTENFAHKKNVKIPEVGQLSIVGVYDDMLYPNIKYHMKFYIDHTGFIVKWHTTPRIYKRLEDNFDAIYQGLIGQIMDYQKLKAEKESRE